MSTSFRNRPRPKAKTKLQTEQKQKTQGKISAAQLTELISMPKEKIDNVLRPQFNAQLNLNSKQDITKKYRKNEDDEDDKIDPDESYDSPNIEENIEIGEGRTEYSLDLIPDEESNESFLQYAWRKLSECSQYADDNNYIHQISLTLKSWIPGFSRIIDIPKDLQLWFENTIEEFDGYLPDKNQIVDTLKSESYMPSPDIIFYWKDDKLYYDIDHGVLKEIILSYKAGGKKQPQFIIGNFDVNISSIYYWIQSRQNYLESISNFLIKKQKMSLTASDLSRSLELLRSVEQKDFYDSEKLNTFKIDKSKTSRIVSNYYVTIPCSSTILRLDYFFDGSIGSVNIIKKAIELHVIRNGQQPLSGMDDRVILKALANVGEKSKNIRTTIWGKLRKLYPPDSWEKLGIKGQEEESKEENEEKNNKAHTISDNDLTDLINQIRIELSISKNPFTLDRIAKWRRDFRDEENNRKKKSDVQRN
jgi:hypothetical protein